MTSRALFRGSWAGFLALLLVASGCESSDEGELEVLIADDLERGLSWEEYDVRMPDGRRIRLDTEGRKLGLATGTRVRVSGGEWLAPSRVRNPLVVATAEPDDGVVSITSAIIPSTPPPPRKVAVILFNFADLTTQPITPEVIRQRVFTNPTSTRAYMQENLYGWVTLEGRDNPEGDVLGWYTIASNSTPCNDQRWDEEALAAAQAAGADTAGYDHIVFWWPRTAACAFSGRGATSGGTRAPTGTFNYGRNTWINSDTGGNVVSHEFGHNFRMSHSGTRTCTDASGARVTMSDTCTTSEYGSRFDVMGSGGHRHSLAYNKGRAGVISKANVITVKQGGTYGIQPLSRAVACGTQAIRIQRGTANEYFYVDYRTRTGVDSGYAATSSAVNGVVITIGPNYETTYGNTGMLDMTPATTSFDDAALLVGQTFTDPGGLVTITLDSRDDNEAQVRVTFPGGDQGANVDGCTTGAGGAGGTAGAAGASGAAGTTGTTGAGGRGGASGAAGATGAAGTTGASGRGGTTGAAAAGGRGGTVGAAGSTGTAGAIGTGIAGTPGVGVAGSNGAAGTGPAGSTGTGGTLGPTGPDAGGSVPGQTLTGGCSCQVDGDSASHGWALAIAAIGLTPALRRRRRRGT